MSAGVQGSQFDPVITQLHYKDDPLHGPMLDDRYIEFMIRDKDAWEYPSISQVNTQVFLVLEAAFAQFGVQLVDSKLENGIMDGELCVIDEISGGSFRLWPYKSEAPNLDLNNVLAELAPEQRLDKDTGRLGGGQDEVLSKFRVISALTSRFKELA